jgi:hypothetical protein
MSTQDDKKSKTKKTESPKAKPSSPKAKPEAGKQIHRAGKPSNPFLVENPPDKRGSRK